MRSKTVFDGVALSFSKSSVVYIRILLTDDPLSPGLLEDDAMKSIVFCILVISGLAMMGSGLIIPSSDNSPEELIIYSASILPGPGYRKIAERKTLATRIRQLVEEQGITVLLIGHEMELVMDICDPIIVLDRGKLLTEGTPEQVRTDKRVLEVYLGGTLV